MVECVEQRAAICAGIRLLDPVAELACDTSLNVFHSRCWSPGSLMLNTLAGPRGGGGEAVLPESQGWR